VVGELGDLERQGVEDPFGLRTPAAQVGHGALELVHPVVLLVADALHAEGLELLEATLQGGIQHGAHVGGVEAEALQLCDATLVLRVDDGAAGGLEEGEALVGGGASRLQIGKSALPFGIVLVESASRLLPGFLDLLQNHLHVRFHSTVGFLESSVVIVGKGWGGQNRRVSDTRCEMQQLGGWERRSRGRKANSSEE